jgi:hypothetical protein
MEKDWVVLVDPWETYGFQSVGAQLTLTTNRFCRGFGEKYTSVCSPSLVGLEND